MNLKKQLVDSGRIVGEMVARQIDNNPVLFKHAMAMLLYDEMPWSSRAGRVIDLCTKKYPYLIEPYFDEIFQIIYQENDIHRAILKILAEIPLKFNEYQTGILVNACFNWLMNGKQSVAVKVYSMEILYNFSLNEPEIIPELITALEEQILTGTAGIKSRGNRIIKKLRDVTNYSSI